MASDFLSWVHFWGWQLIIVAAAITLPLGTDAGQGIRRADLAHRPRGRGGLGRLRGQLLLDPGQAQREEPLRRDLVLHRHDRDHRGALHRQQPAAADRSPPQLPDLRGGPGRAGPVVVRAQRGGVLPDHADPRHHVLLPAQGGRAAGLLATGSRSSTSGRWSSSTSGPARTTCSTPRCPTGRRRWAWSSASCSGRRPGAACSTACSPCAAPGTSCAPIR